MKKLSIIKLGLITTLLSIAFSGCNSDSPCSADCGCNNEESNLSSPLVPNEPNEETNTLTKGDISIAGRVEDSTTNEALEEVTVQLYYNDIFVEEVLTDSTGLYTFENLAPQSGYSIKTLISGYLTAQYNDIEIVDNQEIQYLQTIQQIDEDMTGEGGVTGTITGAVDGVGKVGLLINIREGVNQHQGEIIASTITQVDGVYQFNNLEAGSYTAEITGDGYQTSYITLQVIGGRITEQQNGTINPILLSGETRIVLTWGSSPNDLDSHLTGPQVGTTDRFHIFYHSKGDEQTNLDVDDVHKYGPETITIKEEQEGRYRYSVHDYSNSNSNHSTILSHSNAIVKIYKGDGLVSEFHVPNQEGTLWSVFEIINGEIHPINTMSYIHNSEVIQKQYKGIRRN